MAIAQYEKLEKVSSTTSLPAIFCVVDNLTALENPDNYSAEEQKLEIPDKIMGRLQEISSCGAHTNVYLVMTSDTHPKIQSRAISVFSNVNLSVVCGKTNPELVKDILYSDYVVDDVESTSCLTRSRTNNEVCHFETYPTTVDQIIQHDIDSGLKQISHLFDWYQVPLGLLDGGAPYVWDLRPEPQAHGAHCRIAFENDESKQMLLNTMIAHWTTKPNVQLDLINFDEKSDMVKCRDLQVVDSVACDKTSILDTLNKITKEIDRRFKIKNLNGITSYGLPLDGHCHLDSSVLINGRLVENPTIVSYKTTRGEIFEDTAEKLLSIWDSVTEVYIPSDEDSDNTDDFNRQEDKF